MLKKYITSLLASTLLVACFAVITFADTIRLKDGTVIRGEIVGFREQQFTVLIGSGARGRRSRITLYMEDVDSIEFDAAASGSRSTGDNSIVGDAGNSGNAGAITSARPNDSASANTSSNPFPSDTGAATTNTVPEERPATSPSRAQTSSTFFQINTRVRADNATNGWTNSGLVVRRGQRIRINASGRASLGGGRYSTPTGLPTLPDRDKLMRNEPTGELIAVIGDNNDEFIPVGRTREFTAQREGVLFLGVNEGNLADNSGTYDVVIEAEATAGTNASAP